MNKRIILASASPRRAEILTKMGINDFTVIPAEISEEIDIDDPIEYVKSLAKQKALHVSMANDGIIIAADTIVVLNDEILGKPKDENDARNMLNKLIGNAHSVYTGVCVIDTVSGENVNDYEKTDVFFRALSANEIGEYIKTKEPMDKAGAYGIQGRACSFIERIEGCYYNVMGLPAAKLHNILKNLAYLSKFNN